MADRLRCVVERITYQNEENGYSVLRLRAKGYNDLITAVGNMADTHVGSVLTRQGQWRADAKYADSRCKQVRTRKDRSSVPFDPGADERFFQKTKNRDIKRYTSSIHTVILLLSRLAHAK